MRQQITLSSYPSPILAFGRGWIAVDKPYDLSVHNSQEHQGEDAIALVRRLLSENSAIAKEAEWDKTFSPAPVHRLDVGTSGVLLFALNKARAQELAEQFASNSTEKTYLAVLKGRLGKDIVWNWPLTEKAEGRRDPAGSGAKKESLTRVKPVQHSQYFTLVEVELETGRTHQIRRHAALAKLPVVGDTRYGKPEVAKKIREIYKFDRLALHAQKLVLDIDKKRVELQSALPQSFANLLS